MMSQTVVIVDDDAAFRESLEALLWSLGFECCAFSCGEDFLEACDSMWDDDPMACVLLDYHLPKLSGLDVLDALSRKRAAFPVILLSGEATSRVRREAKAKGAVAALAKPVEGAQLQQTIDSLGRA